MAFSRQKSMNSQLSMPLSCFLSESRWRAVMATSPVALAGLVVGVATAVVLLVRMSKRGSSCKHRQGGSAWAAHVFAHGPLVELVPNRMWQVTGSLKYQSLPRNMVIYRMESKGSGKSELWVHSVIALEEGKPAEKNADESSNNL